MKFDIFRDSWILLALWILITLGCSRSVDAAVNCPKRLWKEVSFVNGLENGTTPLQSGLLLPVSILRNTLSFWIKLDSNPSETALIMGITASGSEYEDNQANNYLILTYSNTTLCASIATPTKNPLNCFNIDLNNAWTLIYTGVLDKNNYVLYLNQPKTRTTLGTQSNVPNGNYIWGTSPLYFGTIPTSSFATLNGTMRDFVVYPSFCSTDQGNFVNSFLLNNLPPDNGIPYLVQYMMGTNTGYIIHDISGNNRHGYAGVHASSGDTLTITNAPVYSYAGGYSFSSRTEVIRIGLLELMPKDSTDMNKQTFSISYVISFPDTTKLVNTNCDEAIIFQSLVKRDATSEPVTVFKLSMKADKALYLTSGSWSGPFQIQQFDVSEVGYEVTLWCSRLGDQNSATCRIYYIRTQNRIKGTPITVNDFPTYDGYSGYSLIGDTKCGFAGNLRNFRVSYASSLTDVDNLALSPCTVGCGYILGIESELSYCTSAAANYNWLPQENYCTSTKPTISYNTSLSISYGFCLPDEYYDPSNQICSKGCYNPGCTSLCNQENTCTACATGYTLYYNLICCLSTQYYQEGACLSACGLGFYAENSSHLCVPENSTNPTNNTNTTTQTNNSNSSNTTNTTNETNTSNETNTTNTTNTTNGTNTSNTTTNTTNTTTNTSNTTNSSDYGLNNTDTPPPEEKKTVNLSNVSPAMQQTAQGLSSASTTTNTILTATTSINPSLGSFFFLIKVGTQLLSTLRFLNVKYADFNYEIFNQLEGDGLLPDLFSRVLKGDDFTETEFEATRGSFAYQKVSTVFLFYYGSELCTLCFWGIVWIICFLKKIFPTLWTFLNVTVFLTGSFEKFPFVILHLALQFEPPSLSNPYAAISFGLAFFLTIGYILLIRHLFKCTNTIFKEISVGKTYLSQDAIEMLEKYKVVFSEMKNTSKHQFFFFFFILFENFMIDFALLYLQFAPILQFLVILLIWTGFMAGLMRVKPFIERETTIIYFSIRICFLVNLFIAFPLLFLDDFEETTRNGLGYAVIAVIALCSVINICATLKKAANTLMRTMRARKAAAQRQNASESSFSLNNDQEVVNLANPTETERARAAGVHLPHQIAPGPIMTPKSSRKSQLNVEMTQVG